jgi:hypothetical protein
MLRTYFVVSVLGQDNFWLPDGNLSGTIGDAQLFTSFEDAESGLQSAIINYGPNFGTYGWEIRTIIA